jgi:hypothetical protein
MYESASDGVPPALMTATVSIAFFASASVPKKTVKPSPVGSCLTMDTWVDAAYCPICLLVASSAARLYGAGSSDTVMFDAAASWMIVSASEGGIPYQ